MTSDHSSDANSSVGPPSPQFIVNEAGAVANVCKDERDKKSTTVCVARQEVLTQAKKACVRSRASRMMFTTPVVFTTPENLQDTIDFIEMSNGLPILKLLFSGEVLEISFDVPSYFTQLKVLRCVPRGYGGHLLIDSSSTYNGVRLDKWQAHRHKKHTLIIGHKRGVRIVLNNITSLPNWSQCRSSFNESERSQLHDHFEDISSKSRWGEVKGTVASIMGIAVGSVKLAARIKGAAGGMYFKYASGFHAVELGMGGAKIATIATAAGGAVALGVGVAAAVYFIPWEGLFDWLKRSFHWLWDKICALWQSFKDWVKNQKAYRGPMAFDT